MEEAEPKSILDPGGEMSGGRSENLTLLKKHLAEGSLAERLVIAYGDAEANQELAALAAVLNKRLAEVRDAIENGTYKLD